MWSLIFFSVAMLGGCYFAGCIPLAFELSERKLRLITVLGAGLLIGTALSVVIPEGVHSIYQPLTEGASLPHGNTIDGLVHVGRKPSSAVVNPLEKVVDGETAQKLVEPHQQPQAVMHGGGLPPDGKLLGGASQVHNHSHEESDPHKFVGLSLVLGFILMLLIDRLCTVGSSQHSHNFGPSQMGAGAGRGGNIVSMEGGSNGDSMMGPPSVITSSSSRSGFTATLGLVVHAAADGLALGAASSASRFRLESIVFIAIMLHKGPAAFGLVSFLLHEGLDRQRIRKHLLCFSLAAPVGAVLTYFFLWYFSKPMNITTSPSTSSSGLNESATGFALLFSAGTFLYVATVHILSELNPAKFRWDEVTVWVLGACLPLLLNAGHSH